jgi:hypothetical protein
LNAEKINKVVYIVGLLLVVLTGVGIDLGQYGGIGIVILGGIGGYFIAASDRNAALITAVAISIVSGGLGAIPEVGSYVTDIVSSLGDLVNASAVVAILLSVYEKATN